MKDKITTKVNTVEITLSLLTKKGDTETYYGISDETLKAISFDDLKQVIGNETIVKDWLQQTLNLRLQKAQNEYKLSPGDEEFIKFAENGWRKNRKDELKSTIDEFNKKIMAALREGKKDVAQELMDEMQKFVLNQ